MTPTIEERVARGARLLDERLPGWAGEIDADSLRIRSCTRCVLGQPYGGFISGVHRLADAMTHDLPSDLGFAGKLEAISIDAEYDALTDAWLAEIRSRTEASR